MSETTRITVKLTPKASKNEVQGWIEGPEGQKMLKVSVTAVPEKGKGNKALIALLSEYFGMPKSAFRIIRGETERVKIIEIQGVNPHNME